MKFGARFLGLGLAAFGALPALGGGPQDASSPTGTQAAPAASATEKTQASPSPVPDSSKTSQDTREVTMKDVGATFKVSVNLVQVHVIVRDKHDRTVEGLKREDFQLYDLGKLQTINSFSVEDSGTRKAKIEAAAKTQVDAGETPSERPISLPERFVAIVYDDVHLTVADAVVVRNAAGQFLDSLTPNDRVGIYTTSGQVRLEFTSDVASLRKALLGILPKGVTNFGTADCPDVSYYMADLIENKGDTQALDLVRRSVEQCSHQASPAQAEAVAHGAIRRKLAEGDAENQFTYRNLEGIIGRLAGMPGERVMLMASPGFQLASLYTDETGIIDRANQANIVINTLDARRLFTVDSGSDISRASGNAIQMAGYDTSYRISAQSQASNVLRDFASGTGGTYFGNSNDLAGGMKLLGVVPETSYVLYYSPENQKMDGRYHSIKVSLTNKQDYSVQARNGYYATKKAKNPEESAYQEIVEAALSQQEIGDMPLELHTQYFKTEQAAMLSVVSHLSVNGVHFRKVEGRSVDELTVATVVFDENGNYVTGGEKIVMLKLLDPTYDRMSRQGLTIKSSFEVKPGRYLVRQVVREAEGAQMAARNGVVEIP
jgi:VWFA-related protein